jgi:MarR family
MTQSTAARPIRTAITSDDGIDLPLIELLFFAYRDFTSDPDQILAELGFGRAHHRILHFVNRMPGLTVAELLDVLKITKQSLARVLKQLIDTGHVVQVQGRATAGNGSCIRRPRGANWRWPWLGHSHAASVPHWKGRPAGTAGRSSGS